MPDAIILLLMMVVFIALAVVAKIPLGVALALSAVAGALAAGEGLALRHLVEGAFGFFEIILIIAAAMIFMETLAASGALDTLTAAILRTFAGRKTILLLTMTFLLMFPGMITGSSLAAVISTGPLIAPVLMKLGMPRAKTGAFIIMGAILGMIAPPVNVLVMIMGGGVDMPYSGLTVPLLLVSLPPALVITLWLGRRDIRVVPAGELQALLPPSYASTYGFRLFVPLILVLVLLVVQNIHLPFIPDIGLPAVFFAGSLAGLFCGRRFNFFKATSRGLEAALPILSILVGVGMFIQIMTLSGARGWSILTFLSLPAALLYGTMAVSMPLFGGISAYGSASILGVPFLLALVDKNALFTSAALSAFVGVGDIVPPSAKAVRFANQVIGETRLVPVLRHSLVPALIVLAWGVAVLIATPWLDTFL